MAARSLRLTTLCGEVRPTGEIMCSLSGTDLLSVAEKPNVVASQGEKDKTFIVRRQAVVKVLKNL